MIRALLMKSKFMSRVEWRDVQQKATSDFSVFTKCFTWKRVLCFFVCPHRFRDDGVGSLFFLRYIHLQSFFYFVVFAAFFPSRSLMPYKIHMFWCAFFRLVVRMCVSHAELYSVWAINLFASLSSGLSFIRIKVQTHTQTHTHSTFQMCSSMWSEKSVRTVHIYSRDMERKLIWFFFFIPVCLIE